MAYHVGCPQNLAGRGLMADMHVGLLKLLVGELGKEEVRLLNLLNVCALCRKQWRTDGGAPVIATQTKLWSMQDGKLLSLGQLAELMGHKLINVSFMGIGRTAQMKLLGNSIHVACMGSMLMAVIAIACPE